MVLTLGGLGWSCSTSSSTGSAESASSTGGASSGPDSTSSTSNGASSEGGSAPEPPDDPARVSCKRRSSSACLCAAIGAPRRTCRTRPAWAASLNPFAPGPPQQTFLALIRSTGAWRTERSCSSAQPLWWDSPSALMSQFVAANSCPASGRSRVRHIAKSHRDSGRSVASGWSSSRRAAVFGPLGATYRRVSR